MARARDPARDRSKEMYLNSDGKMLLKDIAAELGKSDSQIRKWKNQDGWDDELNGNVTNEKSKVNGNVTNGKQLSKPKRKVTESEEIEPKPNGELTDKQWLFCMYYTKYWSPTKAYKKAYDCDYSTAKAHGYKLLRNVAIKKEIDRMKKELEQETFIDSRAVIQKYIDIAFADITDFIDFSQVESHAEETVKEFAPDGKITKEVTTQIPYTYTKFVMHHSAEVDGTLITEMSKGKDGMFKVKLADKMQALAFLVKFKDLLNEGERKRLQEEKVKAETMKIRSETKGLNIAQTKGVDLSQLSVEELRALAARNKR